MEADRSKKSRHADVEDLELIEKLQDIQDDLEKVDEEASDKVLEVEQKYNEIRRPVYVKRNEVIKSIPDFWFSAFMSHPALGGLFNEEDKKVFKYLETLEVEDFKDVKSGYSITFNFKANPYFEDAKLTKNFTFLEEGTTKITGTTIHWKEGMRTANGGEPEMKGNKRLQSEDSFFSWFNETQQKEIPGGFLDEVADMIKEDLWSNPLRYFNNEPDEEDLELDEDDELGGDDGEDDEDDEDNKVDGA